MQTTKEFLPKMITRKSGHLVAVNALAGKFTLLKCLPLHRYLCIYNSHLGLVPLPGAGIYTATKYGIEGFMESLRAELRLSDCDYVRTTVANAYLMRTSGDLPLLSDAG